MLYIRTGHNQLDAVVGTLKEDDLIRSLKLFTWWARFQGLDQGIRPGRYEIKKGMSLFRLARMLKISRQKPVKLVITKIRTKEQLASFLGKRFESDSGSFLALFSDNEALKAYQVDSTTCMTAVIPDTYEIFWTATPEELFRKLATEQQHFWTPERRAKAQAIRLTPTTAYILASIIEEESNARSDKDTIASVYLNRIARGMPLQADPTVKFALKDFGLKRIYRKHLLVPSPYNTYIHAGLPPGPICTPSRQTLEAVLDAPKTQYLYFVAKSDFSGTHVFSETYTQHLSHARAFQRAQDEQLKIRRAKNGAASKND